MTFLFYRMDLIFISSKIPRYQFQLRSSRDNPQIPNTTANNGIEQGFDYHIPQCAKDVLFSLHREVGGADEDSCSGLLIRDDIIVTSHECSKFNFTFNLEDNIFQAVPHPLLNSRKEMEGSKLGFLRAHTPNHYIFVDQPVHKTRMFLSEKPSPGSVNGTDDEVSPVIISCAGVYTPIAHNFPIDGEMIPLAQLAGLVPEDVLWDYLDLQTAVKLSYKKHRWWTRSVTLEDEQTHFKKLVSSYQGPPGSLSIPDAQSSNRNRLYAVLEVLDPRGHRKDCYRNYYLRYRKEKPFSGLHFFDWLDFGPGKFIIEEYLLRHDGRERRYYDYSCQKISFNNRTVYYFNKEERNQHEIYIQPSNDRTQLIARYKSNDNVVSESFDDHPHLYMWDLEYRFYVVGSIWEKSHNGHARHSGLMNGKPALGGGKAYFGKDGVIWGINFSSGHYRPGIQSASIMYHWFKNQGFNVTAIHWVGRKNWKTKSCDKYNWKSIEIPGYWNKAIELKEACYEMTTNPMWILKDDV